MARRRRDAFTEEEIECTDKYSLIDQISMLPDELLVFVLSLLTFKEAAATSILSRRWRYLWTFLPSLNFDGTESLLKVESSEEQEVVLDKERRNFVRWVDHVIALHKGSTIQAFRVYFNLNKTYERSIDKWFRHALAGKVQSLELDLTNDACDRSRRYDECYSFPYKLLPTDVGDFSNSSQLWSMRQCGLSNIKYLKKISMNYVNVNGEALEFFLSHCPLLEHLSVSQSGELTSLKIIGPFPSLKRLEISLCHNLNLVEVRNANLVHLKYEGSSIHFLLENVPLLVEMFIGGKMTRDLKNVLLMFSRYLPQLEIFTIDRASNISWKETKKFHSAVKMSNLKQLMVRVCLEADESLLWLTNLIRASPFLERLILEALRCVPKFVKRKVKKMVSLYPHLKEFKFVGYCGVAGDIELVMHFLESAVSLEKIIIDPSEPCWSTFDYALNRSSEYRDEIVEEEMVVRARAKEQLTEKVPPRINLEIL